MWSLGGGRWRRQLEDCGLNVAFEALITKQPQFCRSPANNFRSGQRNSIPVYEKHSANQGHLHSSGSSGVPLRERTDDPQLDLPQITSQKPRATARVADRAGCGESSGKDVLSGTLAG